MAGSLIEVENLKKVFRQGFFMRRVEAVRGVSFRVTAGEVFGFLGPNGAGKTTTIKILTGLISPSSGHARIFGRVVSDPNARRGLGFLPENPYIYPYLTPAEFVALCGRLSGLRGRSLQDRCRTVLRQVGMLHAADRPARRLSKGMLQRTALAGALVADPELLILDEPMSGLDPIGRREVRDLILEEGRNGRSIFFSSHILSDVETLCHRVAILRQGRVLIEGSMDELLHRPAAPTTIIIATDDPECLSSLGSEGISVERQGAGRVVLSVRSGRDVASILRCVLDLGANVLELSQEKQSLEDLFLRYGDIPASAGREEPDANPVDGLAGN